MTRSGLPGDLSRRAFVRLAAGGATTAPAVATVRNPDAQSSGTAPGGTTSAGTTTGVMSGASTTLALSSPTPQSPVATTMLAPATARPTNSVTATTGSASASAGGVGTVTPSGSPTGSLATTAALGAAVATNTALPLPTGFVGATPMATLTGATPPADLIGRLTVPRLTFALLHASDAAMTLTAYSDLLTYMAKSFGVEVVRVVGQTAADTADAMGAKRLDTAILPPFAYLLAQETARGILLVQGEASNGMPAVSSTVLIGLRNGGPGTLADLHGKTVAFVTADPTFGQILPAYLLATNPRLVENQDYMVLPVPTWTDAYYAVVMGKADAAVLTTTFFQRGLETHAIDNDRVKMLDKSPELPGNLMVARGDLSMSDRDALTALLLTINEQPAMSRLV